MKFEGVWTMLATPMAKDGSIAPEKFGPYIENQISQGISGVMVLGSTGEFYALERDERQTVLREVARNVGGRIAMAAGANAGSTRAVIDNVRMAVDEGYSTVLLAPPYYSNPAQDHLLQHFEAVANAVDIDIIVYDNPAQAGVEVGLDVLDALQSNPRFVAVKEAGGSLPRALAIRNRFGDRYEVLCGLDDVALDFLLWGSRCWMSGPSNFLASKFVSVHGAAMSGDWARARDEMARLQPLIAEIERGKFLARIKYCANQCGLDVGPSRGPVFDLTAEEKARLDGLLDAIKQD